MRHSRQIYVIIIRVIKIGAGRAQLSPNYFISPHLMPPINISSRHYHYIVIYLIALERHATLSYIYIFEEMTGAPRAEEVYYIIDASYL